MARHPAWGLSVTNLVRPRLAWLVYAGAILIAGALVLGIAVPAAMAGWLAAATLFSALPAGALLLAMMMRLIPGAWGEELRFTAEAATLLMPWAALAFIPVVATLGLLYPWMHGAKLTGMQQAVLNPALFVTFTASRFAVLFWLATRMIRRRAAAATSACGVIVLPLLAGIAAFLWLLSLDPRFASSAFGLQFLERELTVAFAGTLLLRLSLGKPLHRLGVLGGVLLTFLLLWAYLEFLSFFINWSTNLPEGAHWYLVRGAGGWGALLWTWGALSGIPLIALLFARARNDPDALRWIALSVLVGKACEMAWVTLPGFGIAAIGAYLLALAGLGLFAIATVRAALRRRVEARTPRRAVP